ncbi:MAG TPA: hypothetical protein DIT89_17430, partial [Planctomycetaceae bacterium]|nr:hypothetical protein [Planctomycetaceae bacterium]
METIRMQKSNRMKKNYRSKGMWSTPFNPELREKIREEDRLPIAKPGMAYRRKCDIKRIARGDVK